jgi:hypothetical protein
MQGFLALEKGRKAKRNKMLLGKMIGPIWVRVFRIADERDV